MLGYLKNLILKFVVCASLLTSLTIYAETGKLIHLVTLSPGAASPLRLKQKSDLEEKDKFYKKLVGKTDSQLESIYKSQWDYHEKQTPYVMASSRNEHLNPGTQAGPYEGDVRKNLATQVLRMRVDAGIKALLYEIKSPALAKVAAGYQNTMDKIRNYPLRLSNKKGNKSGEFRIGYDVLSDNSKVEYMQGLVEAGLYHPSLVGMITKSQPGLEIASFNISSNLGNEVPKATISYPLSGKTIEASLSKSLSSSVSARLTSGQPLRDQTAPHRYEAQISYTF